MKRCLVLSIFLFLSACSGEEVSLTENQNENETTRIIEAGDDSSPESEMRSQYFEEYVPEDAKEKGGRKI